MIYFYSSRVIAILSHLQGIKLFYVRLIWRSTIPRPNSPAWIARNFRIFTGFPLRIKGKSSGRIWNCVAAGWFWSALAVVGKRTRKVQFRKTSFDVSHRIIDCVITFTLVDIAKKFIKILLVKIFWQRNSLKNLFDWNLSRIFSLVRSTLWTNDLGQCLFNKILKIQKQNLICKRSIEMIWFSIRNVFIGRIRIRFELGGRSWVD